MPAIGPAAAGFVAGLMAGLVFSWAPWPAAPCAALGAAVLWRPFPRSAVLAAAAAAGLLWGVASRWAQAADCRARWRDGEQLILAVTPRSLPAPGRVQRAFVVAPARCRGPILLLESAADASTRTRLVVGVWRRDLEAAQRPWPVRADRLGRVAVRHARPLARGLPAGARARMGAERSLAALFGPRRAALAAALTVDADAALSRPERDRFARAGLAHLLSISGFHVGLLAGAFILVLRAARCPADAARLAGTAAAGIYVVFLGAPAPALRALVLLTLWSWARVRQRPSPPAALLAATVIVVAVVDPLAVFEAGPWLSFAGVWGCIASARWWARVASEARTGGRRRILRWAAPTVVSLGATIATAPATILAFGTATPAAVVANIAAVPLAAIAVPAIALALAAGAVPLGGGAALAAGSAALAGLALDLLERVATVAGQLPYATLAFTDRTGAATVAAVAAAVLLTPGPRRFARRAAAALAARASLAIALAAAAMLWGPLADVASGDGDGLLALHFLAVGQGDAAVLRTPRGRWIVIDGGPRLAASDAGVRRVAPFLRRRGARRLALVVASHGDADHLGGLPAVLGAFPADLVLEPGEPLGRPLYREWLAGVGRHASRWRRARAGERIVVDGVALRVWHPDSAWLARREPPNENSVVLSVEYGAFRAVFTGDAGLPMEAERAAAIGRATLLKVGHHGSRSASGEAWLRAVRPAACIVSVGTNRYGHPDAGVLARLRDAGCALWRTDRLGDVHVTTDGRTVRLRAAGGDTTFSASKEPP